MVLGIGGGTVLCSPHGVQFYAREKLKLLELRYIVPPSLPQAQDVQDSSQLRYLHDVPPRRHTAVEDCQGRPHDAVAEPLRRMRQATDVPSQAQVLYGLLE